MLRISKLTDYATVVLAALAAQDYRDPVEIVVAANGCVDGTVAAAYESLGSLPPNWRLRVVELPAAAKWAALNAADAAASSGTLVFLDADIVLGPKAISDIAEALSTSEPRLVQPRLVVERPASQHPIVRSFEPGEDWQWCYVDKAYV